MSRSRWFSGLHWSVWCTLGLMLAAPAAYADGMARRAAPMEQPFSWTGLYVGGHAGLVTGDTQGNVGAGAIATDYPVSGALYGGQIGYNWQHGLMVYGIEGSWSGATVEGSTACLVATCSRDLDWLASVTGRVGYAMGRTLLYGMGGVAWSDVHTHVSIGSPFLSGSATHTGWIAGFGFEYALSSHVSTRIEYAHIDLGSETHNLTFVGGGGPTIPDKVDLKMDTIRLGVNVKLY